MIWSMSVHEDWSGHGEPTTTISTSVLAHVHAHVHVYRIEGNLAGIKFDKVARNGPKCCQFFNLAVLSSETYDISIQHACVR